MSGYAVKKIDDMEAIYGGAFKRARAELGVDSFGLPCSTSRRNADYPEHDHSEDGQEEVYLSCGGSGEIEIDGERHPLEPDTMVRVSSGTKRKLLTRATKACACWRSGRSPARRTRRRSSRSSESPDPLAQAQS